MGEVKLGTGLCSVRTFGLRLFRRACFDLWSGAWSFPESSSESSAVENKSLARIRFCTTTGAGEDESRVTGEGGERGGKGETERGEAEKGATFVGGRSSEGESSRGGSSRSLIAESERFPLVGGGWEGGRA